MAQTRLGAIKVAARKVGVSLTEYQDRIEAGLKHCFKCRQWKTKSEFNRDTSRYDKLSASCAVCNGAARRYAKIKIFGPPKPRVSAFKGKKHTEEAKRRMSIQRMGRPGPWKGKAIPLETRRKISATVLKNGVRGPAHYNWRDGATVRNHDDRRRHEYRWWREEVFRRDKYTCQKCGHDKGRNLRAHHIKPFATHPELRLEVSNGITLCHPCHELEHYKPDSIRNERKRKRGDPLWK